MTSQEYAAKAGTFINQAVNADEAEDYRNAYKHYLSGLGWLELAIKYSPSDSLTQAYMNKLEEYVKRAEEIKEILPKQGNKGKRLGDFGFDGESDDEGDEGDAQLRKAILRSIITDSPNVKWSDIAGLHAAKDALQEATIMPLRCPQLFEEAEVEPWTGILLYGPPGTGKSYLAKAVATASNTTFFMVSASDLLSKWQGQSERLVRELFKAAKERSPTTIFIDEVDSLCRARSDGTSDSSGNSRDSIKTEFLVQMTEAAKSDKQILVLGATNLPWALDEAFLRRFEKRIHIPLPVSGARRDLFCIHGGKFMETKWLKRLASATEGFSGADIATVVKTAKLIRIRKVREATHFYHDKERDFFYPCSSKHPDAFEAAWSDLDGNKLRNPPLTVRDFRVAIQHSSATVSKESIKKHKDWTEDFGMDGGG